MTDVNASDFYDVIVELGEKVVLNPGTERESFQHASIKPNMLNKAIGTTDGAYWLTGVMTFDSVEQQRKSSGSYFMREAEPNAMCMIYALFPEPTTPKIAISHCVECNEQIDIVSHYEDTGEINEYGENIRKPIYAYKDVFSYITVFTKDARDSKVGSIQETNVYLMIPAKYTLSNKNIIMKRNFVYDEKTHQNKIAKTPYQIESIDTSMVDVVDGEITGLIKCLLKESQEEVQE